MKNKMNIRQNITDKRIQRCTPNSDPGFKHPYTPYDYV